MRKHIERSWWGFAFGIYVERGRTGSCLEMHQVLVLGSMDYLRVLDTPFRGTPY